MAAPLLVEPLLTAKHCFVLNDTSHRSPVELRSSCTSWLVGTSSWYEQACILVVLSVNASRQLPALILARLSRKDALDSVAALALDAVATATAAPAASSTSTVRTRGSRCMARDPSKWTDAHDIEECTRVAELDSHSSRRGRCEGLGRSPTGLGNTVPRGASRRAAGCDPWGWRGH